GIVALVFALVLFTDGVRVSLDAKAGIEIDALDLDALLLHHLDGKHGIKATGYQGDGTTGNDRLRHRLYFRRHGPRWLKRGREYSKRRQHPVGKRPTHRQTRSASNGLFAQLRELCLAP